MQLVRFTRHVVCVRLRTVITALLFVSATTPLRAQTTARGTLYIVGGGPQPPALVQEFVSLAAAAAPTHSATIVVFGMASADGAKGAEDKAKDLRALGATAIALNITRSEADVDSIVRSVKSASGVWFIGGDQNKLTAALLGSRTAAAISERYRDGAVIGGTSAGAAVMSAVMITGDEKKPGALRRDTSLTLGTIDRENIVTAPGFGLISNAIIDQHFLRRRRHNRLISLVLEREPHLGIGIDESTAMIVGPDGRWRIVGASVAVVYDARHAAVTSPGATLGAQGITMHVLPAGSTFDPKTGAATLPPAPFD